MWIAPPAGSVRKGGPLVRSGRNYQCQSFPETSQRSGGPSGERGEFDWTVAYFGRYFSGRFSKQFPREILSNNLSGTRAHSLLESVITYISQLLLGSLFRDFFFPCDWHGYVAIKSLIRVTVQN